MAQTDSSSADNQTPTKRTIDTSSSDTNEDERHASHFSPVAVVSPEAGHSGARLTGLPRKVKDTCADWHNYVQEWDVLNTRGMQLITEICNAKIAAGIELEGESSEAKDLHSVLPEELETICQKLRHVYQSMEKLVLKFERMTSCLENVAVLNKSYQGESSANCSTSSASLPSKFEMLHQDVLFKTWPTHMFADTSERLLDMYKKELAVKKVILENVAHGANRETLMAYSAVWLHQPYIEPESETLIEAMVLETGLR